MSKLPIVAVTFWIMKIIATTLGETGADMVSQTLNLGYLSSTFLFLALFAVSLIAQLRAKRYHPAIFWAVILTTSTAGREREDGEPTERRRGPPAAPAAITSGAPIGLAIARTAAAVLRGIRGAWIHLIGP